MYNSAWPIPVDHAATRANQTVHWALAQEYGMARFVTLLVALISLILVFPEPTRAQSSAPQVIYDNTLKNGWQNWSWATTNLSNTSPVHSVSTSLSVTATAWQALFFHHDV